MSIPDTVTIPEGVEIIDGSYCAPLNGRAGFYVCIEFPEPDIVEAYNGQRWARTPAAVVAVADAVAQAGGYDPNGDVRSSDYGDVPTFDRTTGRHRSHRWYHTPLY